MEKLKNFNHGHISCINSIYNISPSANVESVQNLRSHDMTIRRSGFTLVELLVVVAIILLLMAIIVPTVQRVRESANKVQCANHLRTIGQAISLYMVSQGNHFPTGGGDNLSNAMMMVDPPRGLTSSSKPLSGLNQDWGWMFQILPYLDHEPLWQLRRNPQLVNMGIFGTVDRVADVEIAGTMIDTYFCPSRRTPTIIQNEGIGRAVNDYAGNMGAFSPVFESGTVHDP
jgi:prepilin-type N-terminal cleavage/methylation domain-containing protein